MLGVVSLLSAALAVASPTLDRSRLPKLPPQGLARDIPVGVLLESMNGRPLGLLRGLDVAPEKTVGHRLVLRDRRGRLFVLDLYARQVRRYYEGTRVIPSCRLTDARLKHELYICRDTVRVAIYGPPGSKPALKVIARAPGMVGHWEWASFAPRGAAVLAQWSAECEVPVAFLVTGKRMRPYGGRTMADAPESRALGWMPDGSAVVHFPVGSCGSSFRRAGIYAVPPDGRPRFLLATPSRVALYGMWGG
jgi:hypothetical protein